MYTPNKQQLAVKICGVESARELTMLQKHGVQYAGLWYGIKNGKYDLSKEKFSRLTQSKKSNLKIVMVTTLNTIGQIADVIERDNVAYIQLHGFQPPSLVQQIRGLFGGSIKILKVLHINGSQCLEEHLIDRYIEAGTDTLILDSFQDMERIGSTGQVIDDGVLSRLLNRYSQHTEMMVAGGIDEQLLSYLALKNGVSGVDIDTAARFDGQISEHRIASLMSTHGNIYLRHKEYGKQ